MYIVYCFLFVLPVTVIYMMFGETILGLFSDDPEVIHYGVQLMHFMALFGWIYIFTEVYGCVVRGAGSTTIPMIIMILTVCVFRLLVIHLFYGLLPKRDMEPQCKIRRGKYELDAVHLFGKRSFDRVFSPSGEAGQRSG